MKKIFYWSPHLSNVATIKNVINSAKSLKMFSKKDYEVSIGGNNYTIDLTNKNFSNKINNCFVDTDSLDSLKINLISQNQGFIAEIENNNDCFVLKKRLKT